MASLAVEAAPVPLQEVKALLRIEDGREDALIAGFVRSAAAACSAGRIRRRERRRAQPHESVGARTRPRARRMRR